MEKKKILIADRESDFILQVIDALITTHKLYVAYSREEVLCKIKDDLPDLIIIGYLHPRGDSFTLHKELRNNELTRHIPLLIVDVRPVERSVKGFRKNEGLQMNAEGYLSRPVESCEIRNEVGRIIKTEARRNKILTEALEQTERLLIESVESWKKRMTQLVGINRLNPR